MSPNINSQTGFPMAKQSSIDRSIKSLNEVRQFESLNFSKDELINRAKSLGLSGANVAIDTFAGQQFMILNLEGEIAYKKGNWELAEKLWLKTSLYQPSYVTSFAIMLRKEQRFKDEMLLLESVIAEWPKSPFNVYGGTVDAFEKRLIKARKLLESGKVKDKSRGLIFCSMSKDDKIFLNELIKIRDSYK